MIHKLAIAFSDDENSTPVDYSSTQSGDGQTNIAVGIPSGSANFSISCPIDISEIKSVLINSDINATIQFKSGSSLVQSMSFSGNKPLLWQAGFPNSNPITGDTITAVNIVSASGDMAFKAYFLMDV